jgi:hypothetical protein
MHGCSRFCMQGPSGFTGAQPAAALCRWSWLIRVERPTPPPSVRRAMPTGADTCRQWVGPKLQAAGRDDEPHAIAERRTITDRRIVPVGQGFTRRPPKRVDYLLRYTRYCPLAVVEARAAYRCGARAPSSDHGHRDGQDRRRLRRLLEAMECLLEPHRSLAAAKSPLVRSKITWHHNNLGSRSFRRQNRD